jgi:hypothetical protein
LEGKKEDVDKLAREVNKQLWEEIYIAFYRSEIRRRFTIPERQIIGIFGLLKIIIPRLLSPENLTICYY